MVSILMLHQDVQNSSNAHIRELAIKWFKSLFVHLWHYLIHKFNLVILPPRLIAVVRTIIRQKKPKTTASFITQVTQTQIYTSPSITPKCANGDGFYPDISSGCTKFYQCTGTGTSHQSVSVFNCAPPTIFDAVYKTCNYPNQVKCGLNGSNSFKKTYKRMSSYKCPKGDGYYPDFESGCRKFYECLNTGTPQQEAKYFDCPVSNLFDEKTLTCNYSHLVSCKAGEKLTGPVNLQVNQLNEKCFKGNGFYPDVDSGCKKYYKCQFTRTVWEIVHYLICPPNTIFDTSIQNCLPNNQTVCKPKEILNWSCRFFIFILYFSYKFPIKLDSYFILK